MSAAKKSPITIPQIIKNLGGPKEIEKLLPVSASMVRKWPTMGIQWWHWPVIMERGKYRAADLFQANVMAAGDHYKLKPPSTAQNATESMDG